MQDAAATTLRTFTLPSLPNSSTSSLLDAVIGGSYSPVAAVAAPLALGRVQEEPPPVPLADASTSVRANGGGAPAAAPGRKEDDVHELEAKLQKRRSLIPHLENELAELEAQIKAAEERLNRASAANGSK